VEIFTKVSQLRPQFIGHRHRDVFPVADSARMHCFVAALRCLSSTESLGCLIESETSLRLHSNEQVSARMPIRHIHQPEAMEWLHSPQANDAGIAQDVPECRKPFGLRSNS
jgi:hypothetical protein